MKRHSALKPAGYFDVTSDDGLVRGETAMCCHCQKNWIIKPGSGIKRGWCMRCNGLTCGAEVCDECLPWEARLENLEAGRPELTPLPARIVVPHDLG